MGAKLDLTGISDTFNRKSPDLVPQLYKTTEGLRCDNASSDPR